MSVKVSHNERQNGIEVKFSSSPDHSDIVWLKSKGFRWSGRQALWYIKFTSSLYNLTNEKFAGEKNGNEPENKPLEAKKPVPEVMVDPELIRIANMQLIHFFDYKKPVTIRNTTYLYDAKKGSYSNLPPKRKRPDFYSDGTIHQMIISYVLSCRKIIPFKIIFSNPHFRQTPYDFKSLLTHYPHLESAEDYSWAKELIEVKEHKTFEDAEKWQAYREKHFQEGQIVYIKSKKDGRFEAWKVNSLQPTMFKQVGYRQDLLPCRSYQGWITFMGDYPLSEIYLENPESTFTAQPITVLHPVDDNNDSENDKLKRMRLAKVKAAAKLKLLELMRL